MSKEKAIFIEKKANKNMDKHHWWRQVPKERRNYGRCYKQSSTIHT